MLRTCTTQRLSARGTRALRSSVREVAAGRCRCNGSRWRGTTDASHGFRNCGGCRTCRLSSSNRAHSTAYRSLDSQRVQTDSVCGRFGAVFRGVMRQALSLAWETHGHVTYVCVMTEPNPSPSEIRTQLLAAIPREAHTWCDIEVVVKPGVPATEIVRVAETSSVDVLLIGPPRQWTSTTQAVLAKSLCPVLVTHDARPVPYPPGKLADASARH